MANKTATLTHKVRNPQNLDSWLDIWSADVSADYDNNNNRNDESIVIKPSENWQIPITQLTNYTDNTTDPPITIYNVTTTRGTENYLAKFENDGEITNGPEIKPNGRVNAFLNEQGEWAPALTAISGTAGITVDNGTTIKHTNSVTAATVGTPSATNGSTLAVPYVTYDAQGHITATGTHTHTVTGFLTSSDDIDGRHITGNDTLAVSVINSTDLNNTIRAKLNTWAEAGVVAAGMNGLSSVWSTDATGKPAWQKITNNLVATDAAIEGNKIADNSISGSKFNTKLLGVWIDNVPPSYDENIGDLYTSSNLNSNDLNEWDYEHCGIWVQI